MNTNSATDDPNQNETLYLLVFAGVHDSFWTHACDVEQMNQILREKFVELYDMPILENVSLCLNVRSYDFSFLDYIPSKISLRLLAVT